MMAFDTLFRFFKSNTYSWYTPNFESAILHQVSYIFPDVNLVSNHHSYKEKTTKLLPYHSFHGCHIPPRKIEPPLLVVCPKKNTKPPGYPFSSISLKKFKFLYHEVCSIPH